MTLSDTLSTSRVVGGIGWIGASKITLQVFRLGVGAILARLLLPSDFGLIAMVLVFSGVIELFSQLGFGAALIQRKNVTEEHLSSVFWVNVGMGLSLSLLMLGLAPAISHFYQEPQLVAIAAALGTQFFTSSFGIVHQSVLSKQFEFKKLAVVETFAMMVSGVIAILMALNGFGLWSLVAQSLIGSALNGIALWFVTPWRPRFLFSWVHLKELFGFSFNLLGFSLINYIHRNLDNLLIGRFLTPAVLGYYNRAYQFMLFPLYNISGVLGRVLFPALSTIQDDLPKVREVYLRATRYISAITFPMMLGLFVVAPELVQVLYGPKWVRMTFLLQVLCLIGLQQSIETTTGWIYYSQGRTDIIFRWNLVVVCMAAAAFVIGLRWDVEGVTVSHAIAAYLWVVPEYYIVLRLIKLPLLRFFRNFVPTLLISGAMAIIVYASRICFNQYLHAEPIVTLLLCVGVGCASYAGLMALFDRRLFKELFQLVLRTRGEQKEAPAPE